MRYLPLCELVEISPTVRLEKGVEYPFVPMEDITPGRRYVQARQIRVASGGAKFGHGDTLFARITPCLENGKIAQFVSVPGQIAFGSTEYWVFRARPKISDPAFVFYLASADILRKPAEKSMAGASGRQRADIAAVKDIEVPAPSLAIQQRIASILSAYDNLIENNARRITILEEMARRLYEEWFVHFRFPGHEQVRMVESELGLIPEGWKVCGFTELFDVQYGKTLPTTNLNPDGEYPVYGGGGVIGRYQSYVTSGPTCLITSRGNGSGTVWRTVEKAFVTNNSFLVIPKGRFEGLGFGFAELFSKHIPIKSVLGGAAQPQLTLDALSSLRVLASSSPIAKAFDDLARPFFDLALTLHFKNTNLRAQRDLLLPKLISGEIDVSAFPEPEAVAA